MRASTRNLLAVITFLFLPIVSGNHANQTGDDAPLPVIKDYGPQARSYTFIFTFQSQGTNIGEWITLFTLCLAPLGVHLIVGVPAPSYLIHRRPKWHERIGHYNPTSIIWRYFSIFDRRLRAKSWNAATMAASNAHFWTERGWDASEAVIESSRAYCTKLPSSTRVAFLSASTVKTAVVTLQGVQAIAGLMRGATGQVDYSLSVALDTIFFPLATFGLLRLPAALWLTEDYAYESHDRPDRSRVPQLTLTRENTFASESEAELVPMSKTQTFSSFNTKELSREDSRELSPLPRQASMAALLTHSTQRSEAFHSAKSWRGILSRLLFFPPVIGFLCISVYYMIPHGGGEYVMTGTTFTMNIYYLSSLSLSNATLLYYSLRPGSSKSSSSTVIPCVNAMWYKIYTVWIFTLMGALLIIASLETRRTPCGQYATFPKKWDLRVCGGHFVRVNATEGPVGVAMRVNGSVQIVEMNGWCEGSAGRGMRFEALNGSTADVVASSSVLLATRPVPT
ncbi:hypothetical protein K402DRAFT_452519 [Aulographum hederae CBS 113979]|uniref:Uncharacterized protein n=1 Tax=Aulographum hederae CBS 113979 TaxID=1176131 RepID=A0A6G1H6A8_9PEZI|nr:hypothetical protein K402DRAFT_452519 [Aulographum hederae CBS 113979]